MARLFADENFPLPVVTELRRFGHDVLTCHEAGQAGAGVPDDDILAAATSSGRVVLTINRRHFRHLHGRVGGRHGGIVMCTEDHLYAALAVRVHEAITSAGDVSGKLVSVVRPPRPG